MAIQPQAQIEEPTQTFQPIYDKGRTKALIDVYKSNPGLHQDKLETIKAHANYHNIGFYEGEFGIIDAVKQAAGGFFEGFTTLRIADPPDNEYEAVIRNIGHLAGFVPGLIGSPLRSLGIIAKAKGLQQAGQAIAGLKSIPILGADLLTKQTKKLIKPILNASKGSRFKAVDTASSFMLADKAKHMAEGAFHLGVASSISSVWDGVDQMMHSFVGGAMAGGFHRARAYKYMKKGEELAKDDVKFEIERDPERIEGFDKEPNVVKKETKQIMKQAYGDPESNSASMHIVMEKLGILNQIPEGESRTTGYNILSSIKKGLQSKTRKKAHKDIHIATSGGSRGADTKWAEVLDKYDVPVIQYLIGSDYKMTKSFEKRKERN